MRDCALIASPASQLGKWKEEDMRDKCTVIYRIKLQKALDILSLVKYAKYGTEKEQMERKMRLPCIRFNAVKPKT